MQLWHYVMFVGYFHVSAHNVEKTIIYEYNNNGLFMHLPSIPNFKYQGPFVIVV